MESTNNNSAFIPPYEQIFNELTGFYIHLHASLEEAIRLSLKYFNEDMKVPIDNFFLNDHIRFHTKRLLSQKGNIDLEEIYSPIDLLNNGLAGVCFGYSIRVRKAYDGYLPILSSESMELYCSQQLSFNIKDDGILHPVKRPNVMFIWDMTNDYILKPLYLCCPDKAERHKIISVYYYEKLPHPAEIIKVNREKPTEVKDVDIKPEENIERENDQNSDNQWGQNQTS